MLTNGHMKVSDNGVAFLTKHEGFRTVAYKDQVGKWTIGYGHLIKLPYEQMYVDEPISKELAQNILKEDLSSAEVCIKAYVKVPLDQCQFDALISFVFNVGCAAFGRSTLLVLLNKGEYDRAAEQLLRWDKGGGKTIPDLTKRRGDEKRLFNEKEYT